MNALHNFFLDPTLIFNGIKGFFFLTKSKDLCVLFFKLLFIYDTFM